MNCFLFNGLTKNELDSVKEKLDKKVQYNYGDEMYRCGQVGILTAGKARIIRKNDIGISVTMRNISAGDMFGMASVFGEWKEDFSSVTAVSVCEVVYISENKLRSIFSEYPQTAINYIQFLSDRIRFLNRKIDTFSADSSDEKLYEFLLSNADKNNCVVLDYGMAELARRLKIGRSSLYRSIEALESNNLISREKNNFKIL